MASVTVSGTRAVQDEHRCRAAFDRWLAPFVPPPTIVHVGGAVGIDTFALLWLMGRPGLEVRVVVPKTAADQPPPAHAAIQEAAALPGVTVVELSAPALGTEAYHARNRWMVDRSDLVVAFPLGGEDAGSGTWHTVGYARSLGRPHLVVPL